MDGNETFEPDFDFGIPPFNLLTTDEQADLQEQITVARYPKSSRIVTADRPPTQLYVVCAGQVEEQDGFETVATYQAGDFFSTRALFENPVGTRFQAEDDTVCHLIPHRLVLDLARRNPMFGDFLVRRHARRLGARAAALSDRETASVGMARLSTAVSHQPLFVHASTPLNEVARQMRTEGIDMALVRRDPGNIATGVGYARLGVVTGTMLGNAVLLDGMAATDPVGGLAKGPAVRLSPEHGVLDALARFGDHDVHQILVGPDDDTITGVIDQGDILRVLADRSDIIAGRIDHADHPIALGKTVASLETMIGVLQGAGVRGRLIADLVTALNRRIFRRLYEMLAPAELQAKSCLMVMGSEGRGEQILRTDQDNGIILSDECGSLPLRQVPKIANEFTEHLIQMGYPPCPGHIMVNNEEWRMSAREWTRRIRHWIHKPDETALLNLAIFYDAAAVAGDEGLLETVRATLFERLTDNKAFFSHFARPALSFEDQPQGPGLLSLFRSGKRQMVDIKKAAIFPIVHGVRTLALELRLTVTSTVRRLAALADANVLDEPFARDLAESLYTLQNLRTRAQLNRRSSGSDGSNALDLNSLSGLDRTQYDACLHNARELKDFLVQRYHLNLF